MDRVAVVVDVESHTDNALSLGSSTSIAFNPPQYQALEPPPLNLIDQSVERQSLYPIAKPPVNSRHSARCLHSANPRATSHRTNRSLRVAAPSSTGKNRPSTFPAHLLRAGWSDEVPAHQSPLLRTHSRPWRTHFLGMELTPTLTASDQHVVLSYPTTEIGHH